MDAEIRNREIDESLYVPASGTTSFGVVGGAHKGELNTPTDIGSQAEYVKKFGAPTTPIGRAIMQYLRYGKRAVVVRVASGDVKASASILDALSAMTFQVFAKTSGESYNEFQISILSPIASGDFRLVVIDANGYPVETWEGLTKATLEDRINAEISGSTYITVTNNAGNTNNPDINKTYELLNGDSGIAALSAADYVGVSTGNGTGLQCFANDEEVETDLLAVPEISDSAVITALISLAEERGDTYALIDPPQGLDVDEVIDFHNGAGAWSGQHAAFNSSYAGIDWPWFQIYNAYSEQKEWMSPSGITAGIMAYNDLVADPWWAAAGANRAKVPYALAIEYSAKKPERKKLQEYNNINPYINFKTDGICRWGMKTTQRATTALQDEPIRRMMLYAEKKLARVLRYLLFDPNDKKLWKSFKNLTETILDPIKTKRGLYDYRVIIDSTTTTPDLQDQHIALGKVLVKPTRTAKVIQVDWALLRSSAQFEEYI